MPFSCYTSGRSRRVSVVSTETPFEILCRVVKFKYSNGTVRSRLSNRTVTSKYSITVCLLKIMCEKERKKARLVEIKKGLQKLITFPCS